VKAKAKKKQVKKPVKKCKAVNQKGACIVYYAEHTNKAAADTHGRRIRARGGRLKRTKIGEVYKIEYSFPKKKR
jgi:hypothetical protein